MIELLQLVASLEEQRRYQENVPFINVPTEILAMWGDVATSELDWIEPPVFSTDEAAAAREFDGAVKAVHAALPGFLPTFEIMQTRAEWTSLRSAAERALAVFMRRGRLPE